MLQKKKKSIKKKIRQELKAQGFEKEEIKAIIKENFKKDKEQRIVLLNRKRTTNNELDVDQNIAEEVEVEAQEIEVAEPDTPKATEEKPKATKEKKEKAKKKKLKRKKKS